uniref:TAFA chemokine like family member 5 n=1 Tax=Fundulus heteroclitus TaxID=8078 RepID=A0A3Q2QFD4_FUNHE
MEFDFKVYTWQCKSWQPTLHTSCPKIAVRLCRLVAGTCEIITLDRDSSQPRRTIARQTARCACRKGQIAGTTRTKPTCVDVHIISSRQWCEMAPCLDDESCNLLVNQSGWTCTQPGGRVKTTTLNDFFGVYLFINQLSFLFKLVIDHVFIFTHIII